MPNTPNPKDNDEAISTVVVDLPLGETLYIDGRRITIQLQKKSGQLARLWIRAPRSVAIERSKAPDIDS